MIPRVIGLAKFKDMKVHPESLETWRTRHTKFEDGCSISLIYTRHLDNSGCWCHLVVRRVCVTRDGEGHTNLA